MSTPTGVRRLAFAGHSARARVRVGRAVRAHMSHFRPHRTGASTKCDADARLSPTGTASRHALQFLDEPFAVRYREVMRRRLRPSGFADLSHPPLCPLSLATRPRLLEHGSQTCNRYS